MTCTPICVLSSGGEGPLDRVEVIARMVGDFFNAMVKAFGPDRTVGICLVAYGGFVLWRFYQDTRRDIEKREVVTALEAAVQRAANEAREYRVAFFKEKLGWTDEQVKSFILQETIPDAISARKAVGVPTKPTNTPAKKIPGGKKK